MVIVYFFKLVFMLNESEVKELKFFWDKVATVHGQSHSEFIEVNEIIQTIEGEDLSKEKSLRLRELTNNYVIPEWACKAQTILLNLLEKMEK